MRSKIPQEIDQLMWSVAEEGSVNALNEFEQRYPEHKFELARRLTMVRELKGAKKGKPEVVVRAPRFQPRPHTFALLSPQLREFAEAACAPASRVMLALCFAALVPAVVALQLLVPNAAALVFPAWFQATRQRAGGGGIDVMGQRLIFFAAQLFTMLLATVPALLAGAAAVSVACFVLHLAPIVGVWIATVGVLAVLLGELWFGLYFLGGRFEKLDLSVELRS